MESFEKPETDTYDRKIIDAKRKWTRKLNKERKRALNQERIHDRIIMRRQIEYYGTGTREDAKVEIKRFQLVKYEKYM